MFLVHWQIWTKFFTKILFTRRYGSRHPRYFGYGVYERGVLYYFWPVMFGGSAIGRTGAYLNMDEVSFLLAPLIAPHAFR